jgi:carbon-monoxide dehydrogenase medium subunit
VDSLRDFEYFEPTNVDETLSLLNQWKGDVKIIAGGTDLIPMMRDRLVTPKRVIDINKLSELDFIKEAGEGIEIGALTRLRTIETSPLIRERIPLLAETAEQVASIQVRNVGTIAGNLVNASPAADMAPSLLVLDAIVRSIRTGGGRRETPLSEFFTGVKETVLGKDELVTDIFVPRMLPDTGGAFLKVGKRSALIISTASAASAISLKHGKNKVRVALGSVAPTPVRARKVEDFLESHEITEMTIKEASDLVPNNISPITDHRSTAEYRKEVSKVLTKRALTKAFEMARRQVNLQ